MSVAFLIILGVWSMLSILAQFSSFRWRKWLKEKDPFALIPDWALFSHPGARTLHLLYRDQLIDGQFTPWKEVALYNPSPWRILWNPKRRQSKALRLCRSLLDLADYVPNRKWLLISFPYLFILTYIMTQQRQNESRSRQFLLARMDGSLSSQDAEIVFLSPMHQF